MPFLTVSKYLSNIGSEAAPKPKARAGVLPKAKPDHRATGAFLKIDTGSAVKISGAAQMWKGNVNNLAGTPMIYVRGLQLAGTREDLGAFAQKLYVDIRPVVKRMGEILYQFISPAGIAAGIPRRPLDDDDERTRAFDIPGLISREWYNGQDENGKSELSDDDTRNRRINFSNWLTERSDAAAAYITDNFPELNKVSAGKKAFPWQALAALVDHLDGQKPTTRGNKGDINAAFETADRKGGVVDVTPISIGDHATKNQESIAKESRFIGGKQASLPKLNSAMYGYAVDGAPNIRPIQYHAPDGSTKALPMVSKYLGKVKDIPADVANQLPVGLWLSYVLWFSQNGGVGLETNVGAPGTPTYNEWQYLNEEWQRTIQEHAAHIAAAKVAKDAVKK
jgi:hypothetical protein